MTLEEWTKRLVEHLGQCPASPEVWDFLERTERLMATQQDQQAQIDALTVTVTQIAEHVAGVRQVIQAELDQLAAAHPTVDLTALQAAIGPLDASVQAVGMLTPIAPVSPASDESPDTPPAPDTTSETEPAADVSAPVTPTPVNAPEVDPAAPVAPPAPPTS